MLAKNERQNAVAGEFVPTHSHRLDAILTRIGSRAWNATDHFVAQQERYRADCDGRGQDCEEVNEDLDVGEVERVKCEECQPKCNN
jgi:hypothetical protein